MAGWQESSGGTDGPVAGSHHTSLHTTVAELHYDPGSPRSQISTEPSTKITNPNVCVARFL